MLYSRRWVLSTYLPVKSGVPVNGMSIEFLSHYLQVALRVLGVENQFNCRLCRVDTRSRIAWTAERVGRLFEYYVTSLEGFGAIGLCFSIYCKRIFTRCFIQRYRCTNLGLCVINRESIVSKYCFTSCLQQSGTLQMHNPNTMASAVPIFEPQPVRIE